MNMILRLATFATLLLLTACAAQRPVLYPTDRPEAEAEAAVEACMAQATRAGLDYHEGGDIARSTVEGGVTGGAAGAATGAVFGDAGEGAAAGAAHGATHGLLRGIFSADEPDPVYRRFVERCLIKRGYEPIGWR